MDLYIFECFLLFVLAGGSAFYLSARRFESVVVCLS